MNLYILFFICLGKTLGIAYEPDRPLNYDKYYRDPMVEQWFSYNGEPVYLTEREAAWWYSLGEYRPGQEGKYPPPNDYYPERPPYEYPNYYNGGGGPGTLRCDNIPGPMRTRREIREMTATERAAFHSAVLALTEYCPDAPDPNDCSTCMPCRSAYAIFVAIHQPINSPEAHSGAAFLPFHREYLFRFENALIVLGGYPSNLGVPYWDSILDHDLPDPTTSVLFTPTYMGVSSGSIGASAPFAGMSISGVPACGTVATRNAGSGPSSRLFREDDVTTLMAQNCFAHLYQNPAWSCPSGCNFEGRHNQAHLWVSGSMGSLCSPIDPLFWLHHGFIDCLWEDHRQGAQVSDLELEYPQSNNGGPLHEWNSDMSPFLGLINSHGLSTHYTQYYYNCAQRPSGIGCRSDGACNPRGITNHALWCDSGKCRSKINQGGSCVRNGGNLPNNACWCRRRWMTPYCSRNGVCSCGRLVDQVGTLEEAGPVREIAG